MTTPGDDEARDVQQRRADKLSKRVTNLQDDCDEVAHFIEHLRAQEARLVQQHADASNEDERARLEVTMKRMATEVESVQQKHDELETELRSCEEQLQEARRACGE